MLNRPKPKRKRPQKLASKLLAIRLYFEDSQSEILKRLGLDEEFQRDYVSKWERGVMEPPLHVLCAYADICNIYLDVLARDNLVLPKNFPSKLKSLGSSIEPKQ